MHIPDGFLDVKTTVVTLAISAAGAGYAVRRVENTIEPRQVPLLGLAAAFVFAAQMLNFPVAGGTSGHLVGSVMVAVLLGPCAAVLVMTSVLILQSLLFADGGILALGANVFNMALVASMGGYGIYALMRRILHGLRGQLAAAAFGAWCSVILAAVSCAGQLALSGTVSWKVAIPAMAAVHVLIGAGEAVITLLVLAAIAAARPDLLKAELSGSAHSSLQPVVVYGLLVAFSMALFLSPLASSAPDGLEKVAQQQGFDSTAAKSPVFPSAMPEYAMPGVSSPLLATSLAGGLGTLLMFGLCVLLARLLVPAHLNLDSPAPKRIGS